MGAPLRWRLSLPAPVVVKDDGRYLLDTSRPLGIVKIREFWGNVPQVVKAYALGPRHGGGGYQRGL